MHSLAATAGTELKQRSYSLAATLLDGDTSPELLARQKKTVLALGNEGAGLSPELSQLVDCRITIPTVRAKAESLNVAACGAILMYLSSRVP